MVASVAIIEGKEEKALRGCKGPVVELYQSLIMSLIWVVLSVHVAMQTKTSRSVDLVRGSIRRSALADFLPCPDAAAAGAPSSS